MYRLHIDIPLGSDEEEAIKQAKLKTIVGGVEQVNYRLGHDEDRQKSNYLNKTENGHVTNKKTRLTFSD